MRFNRMTKDHERPGTHELRPSEHPKKGTTGTEIKLIHKSRLLRSASILGWISRKTCKW